MKHRPRVCVYCGSSPGNLPVYAEAATELGGALVTAGHDLVYGGGSRGIMRVVADSVLEAGGEVYGVIPDSLVGMEVAHTGLTALHVTTSMHERKFMMADMSDAFIALPGGLGTLEELFETWTWSQLGFHRKPIGLLNISGYFDSLIHFLDETAEAGFLKDAHRQTLIVDDNATRLLQRLSDYQPPAVGKLRD